MTEVVKWRVNIMAPRHMTDTWQKRPSKFNGYLHFRQNAGMQLRFSKTLGVPFHLGDKFLCYRISTGLTCSRRVKLSLCWYHEDVWVSQWSTATCILRLGFRRELYESRSDHSGLHAHVRTYLRIWKCTSTQESPRSLQVHSQLSWLCAG
jgi:hypothetical protein